jgi:winged helix DNA-binding protein
VLELTRTQILAFRRRTGALDERLPKGSRSLRRAAWAGLQDSMPRAAVVSIHARVRGATPSTWEDESLAQVWGPRYQVYVVPAPDHAVFTLARLPASGKIRTRAEELAAKLEAVLDGGRMRDRDVAPSIGVGNAIRYATLTGRLAIRWEGARAPLVWIVPPAAISPEDALLELARRHLHVFGPTNPAAFAKWGGVGAREAARAYEQLGPELIPVRTPIGDGYLLAADEAAARDELAPPAPARLLPSGDAYWLHGTPEERALLVPDPRQRNELWTPRVWPGAVLVGGEIAGTWRRAGRKLKMQAWRRFTPTEKEAIAAEAESLPLPDPGDGMAVEWTAL